MIGMTLQGRCCQYNARSVGTKHLDNLQDVLLRVRNGTISHVQTLAMRNTQDPRGLCCFLGA